MTGRMTAGMRVRLRIGSSGPKRPKEAPHEAAGLPTALSAQHLAAFSAFMTFRVNETTASGQLASNLFAMNGGADGARTRDLRRDRPAL